MYRFCEQQRRWCAAYTYTQSYFMLLLPLRYYAYGCLLGFEYSRLNVIEYRSECNQKIAKISKRYVNLIIKMMTLSEKRIESLWEILVNRVAMTYDIWHIFIPNFPHSFPKYRPILKRQSHHWALNYLKKKNREPQMRWNTQIQIKLMYIMTITITITSCRCCLV